MPPHCPVKKRICVCVCVRVPKSSTCETSSYLPPPHFQSLTEGKVFAYCFTCLCSLCLLLFLQIYSIKDSVELSIVFRLPVLHHMELEVQLDNIRLWTSRSYWSFLYAAMHMTNISLLPILTKIPCFSTNAIILIS